MTSRTKKEWQHGVGQDNGWYIDEYLWFMAKPMVKIQDYYDELPGEGMETFYGLVNGRYRTDNPSGKDDLIVKASAEITSLKSENAELSQYKQKFTEMEQAKMAAELAQKKEELISSVIKSGQITREEIEASEELQNYVNELDKKSLMAIVGERLSASVSNETNSDVETSTVKDAHVSTNLNNEDTDAVSIMRRFLNK